MICPPRCPFWGFASGNAALLQMKRVFKLFSALYVRTYIHTSCVHFRRTFEVVSRERERVVFGLCIFTIFTYQDCCLFFTMYMQGKISYERYIIEPTQNSGAFYYSYTWHLYFSNIRREQWNACHQITIIYYARCSREQ